MMNQMLHRFSHPMLYVNDVQRAADWYIQHFGFTARFIAGPHYASLWHDEMKLRMDLHPDRDKTNVGHGTVIYFEVMDIDKIVADLRAMGIKATDPRAEGDSTRFASFLDCEGNHIGICEREK